MTYSNLQDRQLWELVMAGDKRAFGQLFKMYSKDLFKYGQKFTNDKSEIEDVIQEVYMDLWSRRQKTLIKSSIKFYLLKGFRREIIRRIKAKKKAEILDNDFFITPSHQEGMIQQESLEESSLCLHHAISNLPERQREVIFLRYYQGLENHEIASLMEMTIPSAYNLVSRALKVLKAKLNTPFFRESSTK
jgi:RNA polymerase sigma factor (sigma-70 family)